MTNTILTEGLGFVFWIIAARFYPSSEVGLAAASISGIAFLSGLASLGFGIGLVRYLPEAQRESRDMINSCLTLSAAMGLAIAGVFLLGADFWAPSLGFLRRIDYALAFMAICAGLAVIPVIDAALIARRKAKLVLIKQSVMGLRVPLLIAFASFSGFVGIFGSWILAILVTMLLTLFVFVPRVEKGYRPWPMVRKSIIGGLFRFSLGNYVAGTIAAIPVGVLPLMIANVISTQSAAYFYIAYTMATLVYVIPQQITMSLYAEGSQPSPNFSRDIRRATRLILILLVPGSFIFYFFGGFLLGFFGSEYSKAGFDLLRLLILSAGFVAINVLYITKIRVEKRIGPVIAQAAVTTCILLAVSYALLPSSGIIAVGIAQLASQGVFAVYVAFVWIAGMRSTS